MAAAAAAARPRGASAGGGGVHGPSRVLQAMARGGLRGEAQPSLSIMLPYHRSPASEGEEPTMARRPDGLRPNFGCQKIVFYLVHVLQVCIPGGGLIEKSEPSLTRSYRATSMLRLLCLVCAFSAAAALQPARVAAPSTSRTAADVTMRHKDYYLRSKRSEEGRHRLCVYR